MTNEAELAEILDRCLERVRLGEDPERVLEQHPRVAGRLRPLLAIATELESLPAPAPSVEGLVRAMARMSESGLPDRPEAARRGRLLGPGVWARAAVIVLAVLLGGWGTVTASAQAVSGDLLYPIKRLTERVRFFLTVSPDEKAELRIVFSAERLREAVEKLHRGEGVDEELLREMLEEARLAVEGIEEMPPSSRELLALRAAHLSEYQRETLDRLRSGLPPDQERLVIAYRDRCGRRGAWMREAVTGEDDPSDADPPRERLRRWRERRPDWSGGCR